LQPPGEIGPKSTTRTRSLARRIEQHEPDAAQPAVPRLDGGEGERRRHGGIDRIAAGREHARAGLAGEAILGRDDAAASLGERLADVPVLGFMHGHGGT
jgi:hypothetical protein